MLNPISCWLFVKFMSCLIIGVSITQLAGCTALSPDEYAANAGFTRVIKNGAPFQHVVFESGLDQARLPVLHVYIEGDGLPWVDGGKRRAEDPTPAYPLALELMAEDPSPAIYLGRPCYFGLYDSSNCSNELWTKARYSESVVASMRSVIIQYLQRYHVDSVVLVGYSGGGTLAALLARDLPGNITLVTIAANLDTHLWTQLRGFLPLSTSLNPIDYVDQLATLPQMHLIAGGDTIVPPQVTMAFIAKVSPKSARMHPQFDHSCCWLDIWPEVLQQTSQLH